ncbi:MAG: cob(I)yrinic acid a,c-diamide adenosyltransferase [Bacteroidia bacterium]|nr:cob(I)yrinic acid a,c-diamide adenosyltransferase [Bacteroidia bacterium]
MKIYTKNGDEGTTSLLGGTKVAKYDLRIEAYGTVDELNAYLGLIADQPEASDSLPLIRAIQSNLFVIGSQLANDPGRSHFKVPTLDESEVIQLENSIDAMEALLAPLTNFILPGGHPANSMTHVARCVCRRAERRVVELNEKAPVDPLMLRYLNRLSDWLFVLGRHFSRITGSEEILWHAQSV